MLKKKNSVRVGIFMLFFIFGIASIDSDAANTVVGQWNYKTSNHWTKGPAPAGRPSKGIIVISQSGGQLKMEFKSGMVFNPPKLKYFYGIKKGNEYTFSNSAAVDNEGGIAKNSCNLKMAGAGRLKGKSYSEYSMGGMRFSWGFDIELTR